MSNDNFELEDLIVPEEKKDKYEQEVSRDKQNIGSYYDGIEYLDIDENELGQIGVTSEEIQEIAKKYGKKAALEFIETLKNNTKVETDAETLDSSNNKLNNEITLLTPSFVSPITNEEINLSSMNVYDRIGEIYYHTGIAIKLDDPIITRGRAQGKIEFEDFLSRLDKNTIRRLKKDLGSNWQEKLLDDYTETWNGIIKDEISKEKDKASDRLREDLKAEKIKSEQLGDRVHELENSLANEKRKSSLLRTKVDMLENDNIDFSLEQLRNAKEDLKREKEQLLRPDFVTDRDSNIYDYVVSKAEDVPKARK